MPSGRLAAPVEQNKLTTAPAFVCRGDLAIAKPDFGEVSPVADREAVGEGGNILQTVVDPSPQGKKNQCLSLTAY